MIASGEITSDVFLGHWQLLVAKKVAKGGWQRSCQGACCWYERDPALTAAV